MLLELDPAAGLIRFAGRRALLIDASALGLLRTYLIENVGVAAARTVLTRFGFDHGWRMAEAMKHDFQWDLEGDWSRASARLHALEGLFAIEPEASDLLAKGGFSVLASFEAEQQVALGGRSDLPVCWTISGLLSGYLSRSTEQDLFVLEDRCASMGHAACRMAARTRLEWGSARAEELEFFQPAPLKVVLDDSLQRVAETLKATERKLHERRRALVTVAPEVDEPTGIIARSPAMHALVGLARRVAKVDATVLITGESGSGKERIARLVHDESSRATGPFVAINCGAIAETLLESELFGHARGAFTGANQDRPGLFEAANGGTLLLDEVGEISPGMQVKLLRVLQEREVRRVGENKSRHIDVRVLAATDRDLGHGVTRGTFRQDLYYRLKVVELHVPSLRDRGPDILPLARVLLDDAASRMKRRVSDFTPEAGERLLHYVWPGNVRELENAMERAVALTQGSRVELDDLPEELRGGSSLLDERPEAGPVRPLEDVEKDYIVAALERNGGNQTHTAQQLKIGSATLYRKLKSYGLITPKSVVPPTVGSG
jgi:two-component system, NtrC family, response regulator HydG